MTLTVKLTTPLLFEYLALPELEQGRWDYILKHSGPINPHPKSRDIIVDRNVYNTAMTLR